MRTLIKGIIQGLLSATAVLVSSNMEWQTWIIFLVWVGYYIFGKPAKDSFMAFLQALLGFTMGMATRFCTEFLSLDFGILGFPLAVFFFTLSLTFFSKTRLMGNIPAWFLGLIVFFGHHQPITTFSIVETLTAIAVGLIFGLLNEILSMRLEAYLEQEARK